MNFGRCDYLQVVDFCFLSVVGLYEGCCHWVGIKMLSLAVYEKSAYRELMYDVSVKSSQRSSPNCIATGL